MKYKNGRLSLSDDAISIVLFLISLIVAPFGIVFHIGLLYLVYKQKVIGSIKYLILVTLRGVLFISVGASSVKLLIILVLSLYIIFKTFSIVKKSNIKLVVYSILLFSVYTLLASFISGSYPIISAFKVISFTFTFIAVIQGVLCTKNRIDWLEYLYKWLTALMVVSFFLIPFKQFRFVNSNFQGIYNHVNMMGMMGSIYIVILLSKKEKLLSIKIDDKSINILIILTLYMQFLSASRTGLVTSLGCILIHFFLNITVKKIIVAFIPIVIFCGIYYFNSNIRDEIDNMVIEYIYKSKLNNITNNIDILASRRNLQENSILKYNNNKLFGSGFMTQYERNIQSYTLDLDLFYEPGNLIWMLIGDTGIIGVILFFITIFIIMSLGNLKAIPMLIACLGICMGEMVFFSVNNNAIILYVVFALYIISGRRRCNDIEHYSSSL